LKSQEGAVGFLWLFFVFGPDAQDEGLA
jgi:hypothetical protein